MSFHSDGSPGRLFQSFWMAGFESACHINVRRRRLDLLRATQHDQQVEADYVLCREFGICTVRDGVRWHLIERDGRFDFTSFAPMLEAARHQGIQVLWDLCHYGWPDDVDVFAPDFPDRFTRFCSALARFVAEHSDQIPFYVPINEMSFLAWAAGDKGIIYPFGRGRGGELKRQLVRAVIAGCEAIWAVDRRARIAQIDPVINVAAARDGRNADRAEGYRLAQYEAWDMLAGRRSPELGGHPRYLDLIGVNYYYDNQWVFPNRRLRWDDTPRDDRWKPFHRILAEVASRYDRPIFVAETSHFGVGRGPWLRDITSEVAMARALNIPVEGMCLYPILDRPDWVKPNFWHESGLWALKPDEKGQLYRVLNEDYAAELRDCQQFLAERGQVVTAN